MICQFCGYEFDGACGKYGCPNCNGEGLEGNKMFKVVLTNKKGVIVGEEAVGSWEDHAREKYATVRRKLEQFPVIDLRVDLVEVVAGNYEEKLSYDQRWGQPS